MNASDQTQAVAPLLRLMKRCPACGLEKSIEEFYRNKSAADGHYPTCKDCVKQYMRNYRRTSPRLKAYELKRRNQPDRIEARKRVTAAWQAKHPGWRLAHGQAAWAMKKGLIVKPELCEACGLARRIEKHHPDYTQPLLVMWLCKPCHRVADAVRRRLEIKDRTA